MADFGSYHEFVSRFVGPLVMGGRVEVRDLIGPGVLNVWMRPPDLDATLVTKIVDTLRSQLAKQGPVGTITGLPLDALALAAVWHNLLSMTHPEAKGRTAMRKKARQWSITMLDWAGVAHTRAEVTLRHGVLGGLARLRRIDTHVTFWAGYADFVGVSPPSALVAWPKLRRVREDKTSVPIMDLLGALESDDHDEATDLLGVARAALALSPLTDLSLADRPPSMAFAWGQPGVNALADRALRGAAQRMLLSRGTAALRAVEQATLTAAKGELPERAAKLLLRFHLELALTEAMSSRPSTQEPRAQGAQGSSGPSQPSSSLASQPLAFDAYARLGYARVAEITGLSPAVVQRALPLDPNRPLPKDPPSAPLLKCAGALEVRS
ncbi:MAG: hypothetical protein U0326_10950 [Polyangiales bacterium]